MRNGAFRQLVAPIHFPPLTFDPADTSYASNVDKIWDVIGFDTIRVTVQADNPGVLIIEGSDDLAFTIPVEQARVSSISSGGKHHAFTIVGVIYQFYRARYVTSPPAPIGAGFKMRAFAYPVGQGDTRISFGDITLGAVELKDHDSAILADIEPDPASIIPATKNGLFTNARLYVFDGTNWVRASASGFSGQIIIQQVQQVQLVETPSEFALGGGASFVSPERDYINFESFGTSVFIRRATADTTVLVEWEHSFDNVTFRKFDEVTLTVTAAAPTASVNRVHSVTRRFNRIRLTNQTANALAETELGIMVKPLS
jgi:hypothetical protein